MAEHALLGRAPAGRGCKLSPLPGQRHSSPPESSGRACQPLRYSMCTSVAVQEDVHLQRHATVHTAPWHTAIGGSVAKHALHW